MSLRLIIIFAIIFGVAYGISKALKTHQLNRRGHLRDQATRELLALRTARNAGSLSNDEYDLLVHQLYRRCSDAGIEPPEPD